MIFLSYFFCSAGNQGMLYTFYSVVRREHIVGLWRGLVPVSHFFSVINHPVWWRNMCYLLSLNLDQVVCPFQHSRIKLIPANSLLSRLLRIYNVIRMTANCNFGPIHINTRGPIVTCGHISNVVQMSEVSVKELVKFLLLGDHVCDLNLLLLNLIFIELYSASWVSNDYIKLQCSRVFQRERGCWDNSHVSIPVFLFFVFHFSHYQDVYLG